MKEGKKLEINYRILRFIISYMYIPELCALTACDLLHTHTHSIRIFSVQLSAEKKQQQIKKTTTQFELHVYKSTIPPGLR